MSALESTAAVPLALSLRAPSTVVCVVIKRLDARRAPNLLLSLLVSLVRRAGGRICCLRVRRLPGRQSVDWGRDGCNGGAYGPNGAYESHVARCRIGLLCGARALFPEAEAEVT